MSWTKRQFIVTAFEEIGIASYNYDLQPEMLDIALKRMDSMIASWNSKGIRLGYPIADNPDSSNIDDKTEVPDSANEAIYLNLAERIAPTFGKQVSQDLKQSAFFAYNAMLNKSPEIPEMQFNQTIPAGAGNKWRRNYSPMLRKPDDKVSMDDSSYFDFK